MNQFAGQDQRCRTETTEQNCGHGAEGRRGSSTDIYILSCVKHIASGKLLHNTGSPAWCSAMTWRGGKGEGKEAQEGEDTDTYTYTHTHTYKIMADLHCCIAETDTTL